VPCACSGARQHPLLSAVAAPHSKKPAPRHPTQAAVTAQADGKQKRVPTQVRRVGKYLQQLASQLEALHTVPLEPLLRRGAAVAVLLGATPMRPKEVYMIRFSSEDGTPERAAAGLAATRMQQQQPTHAQLREVATAGKRLLRTVIVEGGAFEEWADVCSATKMFLLVQAPAGRPPASGFLPRRGFGVSLRKGFQVSEQRGGGLCRIRGALALLGSVDGGLIHARCGPGRRSHPFSHNSSAPHAKPAGHHQRALGPSCGCRHPPAPPRQQAAPPRRPAAPPPPRPPAGVPTDAGGAAGGVHAAVRHRLRGRGVGRGGRGVGGPAAASAKGAERWWRDGQSTAAATDWQCAAAAGRGPQRTHLVSVRACGQRDEAAAAAARVRRRDRAGLNSSASDAGVCSSSSFPEG